MFNMGINRRSILLINPRFQFIFMVYVIAVATVSSYIFYQCNAYFFEKLVSEAEGKFSSEQLILSFIEQQRGIMSVYLFYATMVLFVLIFISGMIFSHKICGPLYRLVSYLDQDVSQIRTQKLSFRKMDFFQEIAGSVNNFIERMDRGKNSQKLEGEKK